MSPTIKPLLRRSRLQIGESLPSLVERLRKLNYYDSAGMIIRLCIDRRCIDDRMMNYPSRAETFDRLSQLTQISVSDLYQASPHIFTEILMHLDRPCDVIRFEDGSKVSILDQKAKAQALRGGKSAQFCPYCLQNGAYHRTMWMPRASAVCLEHKSLFVDRCQACRSHIGIGEIVAHTCRVCGADLRDAEPQHIGNDKLGLLSQQVIQSWLSPSTSQDEPFLRSLPQEHPRVLYRFLDGLKYVVWNTTNWDYVHHDIDGDISLLSSNRRSIDDLTPTIAYTLYATAFKALIEWPDGFFDFLKNYEHYNIRNNRRGFCGFGNLYGKWIDKRWNGEEYKFIQNAFDLFLSSEIGGPNVVFARKSFYGKRRTLFDMERFITYTEAANLLHTQNKTLEQLVEIGRLTSYDSQLWFSVKDHRSKAGDNMNEEDGFDSAYRYSRMLNRQEVEDLKAKRSDMISLDDAKKLMGLSKDVILDLVKLGVLEAESGIGVDGFNNWGFLRTTVVNCLENILRARHILEKNLPELYIDLTKAVQKLAVVGYDAARIIKAIKDKELFYCVIPHATNFKDLRFYSPQLEKYKDIVKERNGWIQRGDIARRMKVKETVVAKWVNTGIIKPVAKFGTAQYFSREDLDSFSANHIFSSDAANILGIGQLVVQKWARSGRLRPVASLDKNGCHSYLFHRAEVERLRSENRLTAPQMARRLGISKSQVYQWIAKGKVKPISGPGIDGCSQYLFVKE